MLRLFGVGVSTLLIPIVISILYFHLLERSPFGYALPHSATVTVIIAVARLPESRGIVSFPRFNH